ncbi:hypothetical protein M9H77_31070 [Catharanthus roseus]|uniref:Uncharacterized protein n=1 Tax=Catharanthus roseus TaxID=4058 RepID=A0ACC0A1C9_CATRO|nr:hypothetical protein M9H77_31070 [Catharanthus roseus]
MPKRKQNSGKIKTILLQKIQSKILKAVKQQTVNNSKNKRNNTEALTATVDIDHRRNDDEPRSRMDAEQWLCHVEASQVINLKNSPNFTKTCLK